MDIVSNTTRSFLRDRAKVETVVISSLDIHLLRIRIIVPEIMNHTTVIQELSALDSTNTL